MVGMAGMGGMPGMLPGMGMGMGGFHGIYGMFPWVGGMPGMAGMLPGMTRMVRMTGVMLGKAGLAGMSGGTSGMVRMPAAAGGNRPRVPQSPVGDNVYRPCLDHLTYGLGDSTPPEIQYTGVKTFSLEELGLSPMMELTPQPAEREPVASRRGQGSGLAGRSKKKSNGKGVVAESSLARGKILRPGGRFGLRKSALGSGICLDLGRG